MLDPAGPSRRARPTKTLHCTISTPGGGNVHLPAEIFVQIASFCNVQPDLVRMRGVCRAWKELVVEALPLLPVHDLLSSRDISRDITWVARSLRGARIERGDLDMRLNMLGADSKPALSIVRTLGDVGKLGGRLRHLALVTSLCEVVDNTFHHIVKKCPGVQVVVFYVRTGADCYSSEYLRPYGFHSIELHELAPSPLGDTAALNRFAQYRPIADATSVLRYDMAGAALCRADWPEYERRCAAGLSFAFDSKLHPQPLYQFRSTNCEDFVRLVEVLDSLSTGDDAKRHVFDTMLMGFLTCDINVDYVSAAERILGRLRFLQLRGPNGATWLHVLARSEELRSMAMLRDAPELREASALEARDAYGNTPLHDLNLGSLDFVELVLSWHPCPKKYLEMRNGDDQTAREALLDRVDDEDRFYPDVARMLELLSARC